MNKRALFFLYLSLALTLICGFILMVLVEPALVERSGQGIMDLQFSPNPAKTYFILQAWGTTGRAYQLRWMWLDFVYPVAYGFFLFLAIRRGLAFFVPTAHRLKMVAWLPLMAALMDWAENMVEIYMISHVTAAHGLFLLHRLFVYTKWGAVVVSLILLSGLFLMGLYARRKKSFPL